MPQRKYTQLSSEERIVIETLLRSSAGVREIARMLNRSPSTISRELRRNQNFAKKTRVNKPKELRLDSRRFRGTAKVPVIREKKARYRKRLCQFERINYLAKSAQQKTLARCKKQSLLLELSRYQQTREFVKSRLRLRWSPEQIAGRLQIEINKRDKSASLLYVSPKAIYKYAKKYNLHKPLRRRGKKYRCSRIPAGWMSAGKRNIATRPGVVDELGRLGDLEGDTIFGKDSRDRLLTHVERKTGLVSISLVRGYDVHKIQKTDHTRPRKAQQAHRSLTKDHNLRQRRRICRLETNRTGTQYKDLLRQSLPFLGTRQKRKHQRTHPRLLLQRRRLQKTN